MSIPELIFLTFVIWMFWVSLLYITLNWIFGANVSFAKAIFISALGWIGYTFWDNG